jgi:hypothetical protein
VSEAALENVTKGSRVGATIVFKDDKGDLTDPDTVHVFILAPGGVVTSYTYGTDAELTRESLGTFKITWLAAASGKYGVKGVGIGGVDQSVLGAVYVKPDPFSS